MRRLIPVLCAGFLVTSILLPGFAKAETHSSTAELRCAGFTAALAAGEEPAKRHYAPDLETRIQHIALDIRPDFTNRTIEGKATLKCKVTFKPVRELRLDAVDFDVQLVTSTENVQGWQATKDNIIITFASELPVGKEFQLDISYRATPRQGLYFRTPEMGYREGDTHLFTQGESITGRHWYPSLDAPNTIFTSEITCHVPEKMSVFSNGRLVAESVDGSKGVRVVRWLQDKPHANYLVTLVAGYFKKLEAQYKNIPLAFLTPPSEFNQASNSFRGTPEMMAFFEEETGVPYPWDKYYQICVNDFVAGGMENTSATTLTDHTLFTSDTENLHDSEGLVAHELAHQWFGDLVTCKDWSHIWLNEGFATYSEALWQQHRHGKDHFLYDLLQQRQTILGARGTPVPIVRRDYGGPDEMFGYQSYQKGGWVLHMLRTELGSDLYRKCVRTYLERYRHQSVVTEDFRKVVEELSGRGFDKFFDQWLYHAHHPELEVNHEWNETAKLATISVKQTQKLETNVLLFEFPLTVRFKGKFGTQDRTVIVTGKEHQFPIALESAPESVRFDPELVLLAQIRFTPTKGMLNRQLEDESDVIGRLMAVDEIAKRQDREAVNLLKKRLQTDTFHAVRSGASSALRRIHTEDAFQALLDSRDQPDARVRRQVMEDIGGFYREAARDAAIAALENEKNPMIRGTLLRTLGGYTDPRIKEILLSSLETPSYRNMIADAAVGATRAQDDTAYIEPILSALDTQQKGAWRSSDVAEALSAVAYLARNEDDKTRIREFLLAQLGSQKQRVRIGAINALGVLGDPKARGPLEKFLTAARENRERSAAQGAINALQSSRQRADQPQDLRQEVLDLQTTIKQLKEELEAIRKDLASKQKSAVISNGKPSKANLKPPAKSQRTPKLRSAKAE